jgi:hypothetical protein
MRWFLVFFILYLTPALFAQTGQTNVFPDLQASALIQALRNEYKTNVVLDYSVARDTLFSRIDARGDSLECIYTGMKKFLTPGADPTEAVFMGGLPNGINTEHSWPQSKGATGLAFSDMHHLFPSRVKTNADRGDFMMAEIPDNETKTWYLGTTERSSAPVSMRDLYSELVQGKFEPRESVKGNIARALFYFYTMYKEQADAEDPAYFNAMKSALCEWHYLDPVDSLEWVRNKKIAFYQGGKENPFILDCSLVSRAYCNNIDQACESALVSSAESSYGTKSPEFRVFPNPVTDIITIEASGIVGDYILIQILNGSGDVVISSNVRNQNDLLRFVIDFSTLTGGIYCVRLMDAAGIHKLTDRVIKTN